jgi:hypothetical protein
MSKKPDLIEMDEAIATIMQKGKTRRQAKAILIEAMRQGKLAPFYIDDNGEKCFIPKEAWPKIN